MSRGNHRSHHNSWIGYHRLSRTMITGHKRKAQGHPADKLSLSVPRATWRAVLFSEIVWPTVMAVIFTVAYMFVKSFPDGNGNQPPSPLVRIIVISVGPIIWNAGVLVVQFFVSVSLGPIANSMSSRFGAIVASFTHVLGLFGMIGFFELLVCPELPLPH